VIGDFHEPYGAIFGDFDKVHPRFIDAMDSVFWQLSVFCAGRETFVTTSQRHYKTYATYIRSEAVSICPSLILHGRTEIKARALVLGEVSALSFCLHFILPAKILS
jgi:hypothetical protein